MVRLRGSALMAWQLGQSQASGTDSRTGLTWLSPRLPWQKPAALWHEYGSFAADVAGPITRMTKLTLVASRPS